MEFGKRTFDSIKDFSRNAKMQLVQTDVLFRLISLNRPILINNTKIFNSISPKFKGGYNIYQVFVTNYLGLLEKYQTQGQISKLVLFNEKSKLLRDFVIPWTITLWMDQAEYTFDKEGAARILFKKYCFHPLFYIELAYLPLRIIKNHLRKIIKVSIYSSKKVFMNG